MRSRVSSPHGRPARPGRRGCSRPRRGRAPPRACAPEACRRRRSSRPRPTRLSSIPNRSGSSCSGTTGTAAASSWCAATAAATGWSSASPRPAPGSTRSPPTGGSRRGSRPRNGVTSTPPSPRRRATPGCSAAPRPIGHLEALDGVSIARRIARAGHPSAHRRAGATGRLRRGLRGAARPRCGGRLHTIDATVNDDSSPAAEPRTVVLRARRRRAQPRGPLLWRWSGPIVLLLTIVYGASRSRSPGAPTSGCAAASASW